MQEKELKLYLKLPGSKEEPRNVVYILLSQENLPLPTPFL